MKMLLYQIILLVLLVHVKDSVESTNDDIMTALQDLEIRLKREMSDVHDKLNHMSDSIETLQADLYGIVTETQSMNFKLTELEENCSLIVTCQNETISKLEETGKNITDTLPNLKLQGEPVGENTTKQLENTDQCPLSEGFILSPNGDQCFKRIGGDDQEMSWDAAVSYCRENQLELAGPLQDHNAAWLQGELQDKYGDNPYGYWLNCRGSDDGVFTWRTPRGDTLVLPSDSPLWFPGYPGDYGFGSTRCVWMTAHSWDIEHYPGKLYLNWDCSRNNIPLCERIMQ